MQGKLMTIVALTFAAVASGVVAAEQGAKPADPALTKAIAGEWRSAEQKSRDEYRHPAEALTFWGLKPGMTILEVQPGGGWWTEILAPYARMTGGEYHATGADLANPKLSEGARKSRAEFEARLAAKPRVYGKATVHNFGPVAAPLPANTFDFILTARSVHGWAQNDQTDKVFANLFQALKPGGTLALEQHRAAPGNDNPKMGYVTEEYVLEHAKKAGFELVGRSEINANPKDTKDHPFGVWTLPPTRTSVPYGSGQPPNPAFDHSKYDAVGESDRMTLRFRKPG
jgi:predicted methyltransferase